ncbi:MAG: PRC-barrel domain-containing protein [Burkholderiales bacterium]
MKRTILSVLIAGVFAGVGTPAMARDTTAGNQPVDNPASATEPVTANPATHVEDVKGRASDLQAGNVKPDWAQIRRGSKLTNSEVRSSQGQKLGTIRDTVIDPSTGRVTYVVVGMGNRYHPVPWSALRWDRDHYVVAMDAEQMRSSPSFDGQKWPDMSNEAWHNDNYRYYNQRPYWGDRSAESDIGRDDNLNTNR